MLYFKDVPVVIEPGVAALEVGLASVKKGKERLFFVPFERVAPCADNSVKLPFIMSSNFPHVFAMRKDVEKSPFLLVYDVAGKLSRVYTRDEQSGAWTRNETAPEQVGETVTHFSVRFSFDKPQNRDRFVALLNEIMSERQGGKSLPIPKVNALFKLLATADHGPVMLPVAIAKIA